MCQAGSVNGDFPFAATLEKRQVQSFFFVVVRFVAEPTELDFIAIIKFYAVRKYLDFFGQCEVKKPLRLATLCVIARWTSA